MKAAKCKICRTPYRKMSMMHKACSPECAIELVNREKAKKARKELREKRIEARPRRDWMKLAQQTFNAYIRERDRSLPCICCGQFPKVAEKYGGVWDAGHYLSVGSHPELRFVEDNCHRQLKTCNAGSGRFSGKNKTVSQSYRERLIEKIGMERVEFLEGPHPAKKYTITELQDMIAEYKAKLSTLKKSA